MIGSVNETAANPLSETPEPFCLGVSRSPRRIQRVDPPRANLHGRGFKIGDGLFSQCYDALCVRMEPRNDAAPELGHSSCVGEGLNDSSL